MTFKEIIPFPEYEGPLNPHLMRQVPTHVLRGVKVKTLVGYQTEGGPSYTTEIMEGPDKGKWTTATENELERT